MRVKNWLDRSETPAATPWVAILSGAVLAIGMSSQAAAVGSAIVNAAQSGDFDQVRSLIDSGTDVNVPANDGTTALTWAAYQSDPEMVRALIAAGADPNAKNNFGVTPLLQASRTGDTPVIEALLEGGADIVLAEREGETPLMAAARAGSVPAVTLLLEHGADPNATESMQDQTALMWAAAEGHLDVVDTLLNAGADPNMQARVSELSKRNKADFPSGGFTALMWATRNGSEEIVQRLLDGGADINLKNGDGASALMIAIVNDRFDFAAKLLDLGADANDGSLYEAVIMRDATTDWLAKDGTQWRADYTNELTALDLQRLLLDAGADPNKPFVGQLHSTSMCCDTSENSTPFYRAAIAADVEGLKLMLDHGADLTWVPDKPVENASPFASKNVGKTALMVAMSGGKGVGMAGGPGDIREGKEPPFREKANREPADAVTLLLAAGADPDALTPDGDSALHLAAKDGKLDIIRILADNGATLDLPNADGETALEIVEKMPPREPPPNSGALAGMKQGAQPEEVAALLRELMEEKGLLQASLNEDAAQ
jgi:ankyrin repeat protein